MSPEVDLAATSFRAAVALTPGDALSIAGELLTAAAAQPKSLRVPEADLALARRQAEQKGLPYQTYIKSLLHETLAAREKRKAG